MPEVSVLIPLREFNRYAETCIESVFRQNVKASIEILFAVRGENEAEVRKKVSQYPKGKLICRCLAADGLTISGIKNLLMDQARGKYLAFVDSDDELSADYLNDLYETADRTRADLVFGTSSRLCEDGKQKLAALPETPEETAKEVLEGRIPGRLTGCLIRTSLVKDSELRCPETIRLGEERIFLIQLLLHADRVRKADAAIYYVNQTAKAERTGLSEEDAEELLKANRLLGKRLKEAGLHRYYKHGMRYQMAATKLRILQSLTHPDASWFDLYQKAKLWKEEELTRKDRIFLYICHFKWKGPAKVMIFWQRHLTRRKSREWT